MICSRLHCCCNVSICVRAVRPPGHLRRHHPHQSLFACNRRTGLSYFKPAIPMRPADRTPHPDGFTSFIPTDFNVAASTHLALVHVSTFHLALVHLSSCPCPRVHLSSCPCPPFLLPLSTFPLAIVHLSSCPATLLFTFTFIYNFVHPPSSCSCLPFIPVHGHAAVISSPLFSG
jgi:hypothetical protein